MICGEGNVGDELADGPAAGNRAVGERKGVADILRQSRPGERSGDADKKRGQATSQLVDQMHMGEPNQDRSAVSFGLIDGCVHQHQTAHLRTMPEGPAHRNDAAPIVRHRHDRTRDAESVGETAQIIDPLGQHALSFRPV